MNIMKYWLTLKMECYRNRRDMRYFLFFMFLILATVWSLHEEEIDIAIFLIFLDIFYIFLFCH